MQAKTNMKMRPLFFCQGHGRGANMAIPKKDKANTLLRGCDNNPEEPAAIHAAANENIIRIVSV